MRLRLLPCSEPAANAELCALLVRGDSPAAWMRALAGSGVDLSTVQAFAIPGDKAGTLAGCLLVGNVADAIPRLPLATPCVCIAACLYIPRLSMLHPRIGDDELQQLLRDKPYFMHPAIGLVALAEPIRWEALMQSPREQPASVLSPAASVFIPSDVKGFEIRGAAPEDELEQLAEKLGPEKQTFDDRPLSFAEKAKLMLYRKLFPRSGDDSSNEGESSGVARMLEKLGGSKGPENIARMRKELEDLEQRNASEMDKLLRLLKENPEEALKYAIPLGDGTERGMGVEGTYRFGQRWSSFSLSGGSGGGSGGISLADRQQQLLREGYQKTAEDLLAQGDYRKAAFVYLKLLKDYHRAADILGQGKLYGEAAAIHLKYTGNKNAAAGCYEQGNMLSQAIALYEALGQREKAGDLYVRLGRRDEANRAYQHVADNYTANNQHLKAATLCREKMGDRTQAQGILLTGWRAGRDRYNCLHTYFSYIADRDTLAQEIVRIYHHDVDAANTDDFLKVLRPEMQEGTAVAAVVRGIALEIISARADKHPTVVSELRYFSAGDDKLIGRDILRWRGR